MRNTTALILLSLAFGSCRMTEAPQLSAKSDALTQYVWRGLPMSARPVAQGSMTADFQAHENDRLRITAWGSMSLTAGNGDAVFQDSEILDLDETRFIADYSRALDGRLGENFHAGVINYAYSSPGSSTRELYAGTHWTWDEFLSTLTIYWDVDERDGMYLNGSVGRNFQLDEDLPGYWRVSLGFGTSGFNRNTYGDDDAGFADLVGELGTTKQLNKNTQARAYAAISNLFVDDAALDAASIETLNFWLGAGLTWSF